MHIPNSMLHGAICPVTLMVSALGVGAAVYSIKNSKEKFSASRVAGVSGLIFALQMLNYPIAGGTSGHLLGGMLAVSLLGVPQSIIALTAVFLVQCFLFGDGGTWALGANILNMALIGVVSAGGVHQFCRNRGFSQSLSVAIGSLLSVLFAAAACSFEISLGAVSRVKVFFAMISAHFGVGLGEAALTLALAAVLAKMTNRFGEKAFSSLTWGGALAGIAISPFASPFPDALEYVSQKMFLFKPLEDLSGSWLPGYQIGLISHEYWSVVLSGALGVLAVAGVTKVFSKGLGWLVKTAE